MRVIAGVARSLNLKTPSGLGTRPTTDRIKETIFNMLMPFMEGAEFLDLFSGSGGIGIEALSRGAKHCTFIENNSDAYACIKENLVFTKLADKATIWKQDVVQALSGLQLDQVDLVFMDPPYDQEYEKKVLEVFQKTEYITKETLIVVEASLKTDFSYLEELGFFITKEKIYKTNKHVFVRRK